MEVDDGDMLLVEDEEKKDPVIAKAETLVEKEMCHIAVHTNQGEFVKDVNSRVMFGTHRPIIYLDAPSSKAKVFSDLFEIALPFAQHGPLFAPCGARFEFLSFCHGKFTKNFRSGHHSW